VLGLNPHCGDGGVIGTERRRALKDNKKKIFEKGISFGPFPRMDFGSGQYENMMQL
jgi:4-hydroxythreonine-4-phosphate dehydrogenase